MVCFQFLIDYRHLLPAWKVKQTLYWINKDKLNKKLLKYLVLTVLSDLSAESHLERTCTFFARDRHCAQNYSDVCYTTNTN